LPKIIIAIAGHNARGLKLPVKRWSPGGRSWEPAARVETEIVLHYGFAINSSRRETFVPHQLRELPAAFPKKGKRTREHRRSFWHCHLARGNFDASALKARAMNNRNSSTTQFTSWFIFNVSWVFV